MAFVRVPLTVEVVAFQLAHQFLGSLVKEVVEFVDDLKCPATNERVGKVRATAVRPESVSWSTAFPNSMSARPIS